MAWNPATERAWRHLHHVVETEEPFLVWIPAGPAAPVLEERLALTLRPSGRALIPFATGDGEEADRGPEGVRWVVWDPAQADRARAAIVRFRATPNALGIAVVGAPESITAIGDDDDGGLGGHLVDGSLARALPDPPPGTTAALFELHRAEEAVAVLRRAHDLIDEAPAELHNALAVSTATEAAHALARTLTRLGLPGAGEVLAASLRRQQALVDRDPGSESGRELLAAAYVRHGDLLCEQNDPVAVGFFEEAVTIRRRIVAESEPSALRLDNLSVALCSLGRERRRQGDLTAALAAHREQQDGRRDALEVLFRFGYPHRSWRGEAAVPIPLTAARSCAS